MAKPRKKSPRRLRQAKAHSSQALNGDLFRIAAETATDIIVTIDERTSSPPSFVMFPDGGGSKMNFANPTRNTPE